MRLGISVRNAVLIHGYPWERSRIPGCRLVHAGGRRQHRDITPGPRKRQKQTCV